MMMDHRIIEQFNKRAPFELKTEHLLVLAQIGSHSHNTVLPSDHPSYSGDVDYMGIVLPPIEYAFKLKEWDGCQFQYEDLDCTFYSFQKFFSLAANGNPNVVTLLWQTPETYLISSRLWEMIVRQRNVFSSVKMAKSFLGYANGQAKRMEAFTKELQDSYDDAVKLVESVGWDVQKIVTNQSLPMPKIERDVEANKLTEAKNLICHIHAKFHMQYMGEKRKNLVRQYGYDVKNAAHLIRLMRMCVEFLQIGVLQVYRTVDAEEIKSIKSGQWSVGQVKTEADRLESQAQLALKETIVSESPDYVFINQLLLRVIAATYGQELIQHLNYIDD